jgi:hypothetical protein
MPDSELRAFDALATHARLSDLVAIVRAIATSAAEGRKTPWTDAAKVKALGEEAKLTLEDAATPFGNALSVLERGPESPDERALAQALWAHAIAEMPPKGREDEDRVATDVLWLAVHTPFDATRLLDRALGDGSIELWDAIADRIRRVDQGKLPALGRAEGLVGCAAIAQSRTAAARKHAASLAKELDDPAFVSVLAIRAPAREETLEGELTMAPRGAVATTALAVTGLLFAYHAVRLVARLALAYRCPAELTLSESGVHVHARIELLGRTLRERDYVILRGSLVRATREVRFPRLPFYVGLFALAVGSYLGVATLLDGIRAASPSLLLTGLLIVAAGVLLEMLFGSIEPATTGRCRLLLVPARGAILCVARLEPRKTDAALLAFARSR